MSTGLRRLYYSIGEVAEMAEIPAHVLRYWESEFAELSPHKGRAGNRLYQEKDIELVLRIKKLLYEEKYTIAGARAYLAKKEEKHLENKVLGELKVGLQEILDILNDNTGRSAVR